MYPHSTESFGNIALEDGLLVVDAPAVPDLDMLADAFVTFADMHFDPSIDGKATEVFSWTEVADDQFEDACLARLKAQDAAFLQAVWTRGRLGIAAKPQRLAKSDWEVLFADLIASQEEIAVHSDSWTANFQKHKALPKVDRRQPIKATPAQLNYLRLSALQDDSVHPTVSMPPIYLTSPNVPALEATFEALQERHEILHMSFADIDGGVFLRLTDEDPLPFATKRSFGSLQKIEDLAQRVEADLSERLCITGPLWNAVLVRKGAQAALVCVLSETIADPHTAKLLREEVLTLYAWFQNGSGPEPTPAGAGLQFIETAIAQQNIGPALAWWDTLPLGRKGSEADPVSEVAPVVVWDHALPADLCARLETQTQSAQAVIFRVFLELLGHQDGDFPDWVLARSYDLRPPSTPNMLGQFSLDTPVWLGGLSHDSTVKDSAERMTATLRQGVVSLEDLSAAQPNSLPDRIPYLFDWRPDTPSPQQIALPQDITLRVWREGETIKTQWAIRRDHPLSLKERLLRVSFQRELGNAVNL